MQHKQLIIAKSWADSIEMLVTSDINSVNKKRTRQKKSYEKQKVIKNSDAPNNIKGINRINVKKNNKKEILQQFETWWAEYPNKKSKQDALKIFEKLMEREQASFDELLAGAKAYAEPVSYTHLQPPFYRLKCFLYFAGYQLPWPVNSPHTSRHKRQ